MYLREDGTPYYVGKGKDYRAYHRTTHGLVVLPPADRIKKVLQGLTEEQATEMIIMGFIEPFAKELPMEYALELNRLIELQMEGAVG